jgi:hypothetical protein
MAITHNDTLRNFVRAEIISKLGAATAVLKLKNSSGTTLATISGLSVDATGTAGQFALTSEAGGNMEDTSVDAGTAVTFSLETSDASSAILGTVGTTGTDIVLSSNDFSDGDAVRINSFTYTCMA